MAKLNVFVSLVTKDNDYQLEQAAAAEDTARRMDVSIQIMYAANDAVKQSQQLLDVIQNRAQHPDAILVMPVGTGMPLVADAAVAAGIGWGIINREVDYLDKLRGNSRTPAFSVATDQEEIGRIQGRQFGVLLKNEGAILYIEGPSTNEVVRMREAGMLSTKPSNLNPKMLKGDWTEAGAYRAVKSWLALSTSQHLHIRAIGCQNDAMAMGARRAFEEVPEIQARKDWLSLPFTGVDGLPKTGQEWVRRGLLAATIVVPPTMGLALEMMIKAIRTGVQPPPRTLNKPIPYPPLEEMVVKPS